eukprot:6191057-Pleurochrysis_carterae.AAC.4
MPACGARHSRRHRASSQTLNADFKHALEHDHSSMYSAQTIFTCLADILNITGSLSGKHPSGTSAHLLMLRCHTHVCDLADPMPALMPGSGYLTLGNVPFADVHIRLEGMMCFRDFVCLLLRFGAG